MTQRPRPRWRKSSFSAAQNNCVELADTGTTIMMRSSNRLADGALALPRAELAAFVAAARAGDLDDLARD